jgi:hypothetical protein
MRPESVCCAQFLCAVLSIGCTPPDPADTASGSGESTSEATSLPTSGSPTTDDTDEITSSTSDTTGEPPAPGSAWILYNQDMPMMPGQVAAVRAIEVALDGGGASPPITVLAAPVGSTLSAGSSAFGHAETRWTAMFSAGADPRRVWLIDRATRTATEVTLPPEIERVLVTNLYFTGGEPGLRVTSAPLDDNSGEDLEFYVCPIGDGGTCSLRHVDPPVPANRKFAGIHGFSGAGGWILYGMQATDGPDNELYLGDLEDPADATMIASIPAEMGVSVELSPDAHTIYLTVDDVDLRYAIDITSDPPGPLVELHALAIADYKEWNSDRSAALLWDGPALTGDLYIQPIAGAVAGPLQPIHTAAPGHVFKRSYTWSPDDTRVLFTSDHETPDDPQLYLADAATPAAAPVRVNAPLGPGGKVNGGHFLPDSRHALYYSTPESQAQPELHWVSLDPPGDPVQISLPQLGAMGLLNGAFEVSADSRRIVFTGEGEPTERALYLVDIVDGAPTPAIDLTPDIPVQLQGYLLPGAGHVVFKIEDGGLALISLDPPQPPLEISDPGETIGFYTVLPPY